MSCAMCGEDCRHPTPAEAASRSAAVQLRAWALTLEQTGEGGLTRARVVELVHSVTTRLSTAEGENELLKLEIHELRNRETAQ